MSAISATPLRDAQCNPEVLNKLIAIREIKKAQLQEFFKETIRDILTLSQSSDIFTLFHQLTEYYEQTNPGPSQPFKISTPEYQQIIKDYGAIMDRYIMQCMATATFTSCVLRMDM